MKKSSYELYSTTKDAWAAMYQTIQSAQRSIFWEVYMFVDDDAGRPFFDLLEKKAAAGVVVRLIVDSLGSFWLSQQRIKQLRASGVDVILFHERKKKYRGFWQRLWARTHRKVLIVDEQIGFVGGVNIRKDMHDWQDIMVRFEGDAVAPLLRYFARSYIIAGGDKKHVRVLRRFRVTLHPFRDIRAIFDEPLRKKSYAKETYVKALKKAKKRVVFFSPYYVPDREFLAGLYDARRRGVRVDILLPLRSDLRLLTYVAYGYIALMEKIGVNVHLTPRQFHGKGVVVDDEWAMVGSSNIDQTSFRDNYEANISIHDKRFVSRLRRIIDGWLSEAKLSHIHTKKHDGVLHRAKTRIATWLYHLWYR